MNQLQKMDTVQCKELIVSTIRRRGKGVAPSYIRVITEVFEKDGTKIAEHDPHPETYTKMDMVHFGRLAQSTKSNITPEMVDKWERDIQGVSIEKLTQ